jgi:hypothetical protein
MKGGEWIQSGGGPLVLVAEADLPRWFGGDAVAGESLTDYDHACAVAEYIQPITVRDISVVVIGEEPDATSVTVFDGLTYWVRWRWAPNEDEVWEALSAANLAALDWKAEGEFEASAERYRLFDSAFPGAESKEFRVVAFEAGRYVIETAVFEPSGEINLMLHRFRSV